MDSFWQEVPVKVLSKLEFTNKILDLLQNMVL